MWRADLPSLLTFYRFLESTSHPPPHHVTTVVPDLRLSDRTASWSTISGRLIFVAIYRLSRYHSALYVYVTYTSTSARCLRKIRRAARFRSEYGLPTLMQLCLSTCFTSIWADIDHKRLSLYVLISPLLYDIHNRIVMWYLIWPFGLVLSVWAGILSVCTCHTPSGDFTPGPCELANWFCVDFCACERWSMWSGAISMWFYNVRVN